MKIILFLFAITIGSFFFAQENVKGTSYTHFQIKSKKDTIDFVIADTNLNSKKPILLWCQGSQPVPLFIESQGKTFPSALGNFDIAELNSKYHVVVVSKPHTPLSVDVNLLNKQYNYITDTSKQYSYSVDYLLDNYAENYVRRANTVLKYLAKQKWIDDREIMLAGHSEGSRVAVEIAHQNKNITKLGLFGYNPNNRLEQAIRQARKDAENNLITWGKADSITQEQIEFYMKIQNKDSVKANPGLVSWESFAHGSLEKLIHLKIPIYIAYGSDDIVADYCDLLPLDFIENKKADYTIKRYPNLDHNFFPTDENGQTDYQNGQWISVMHEFLIWIVQ